MPAKISVIIPVYNEAAILSLCLDSLLNNEEKQVEIVVVDDGSTDSSLRIARRYAELNPCIRVLTQANAGVCEARNHGMEAATGEFVTFVDSDAYVDSLLLDHYLQLQAQGNYDLVACGIAQKDTLETTPDEEVRQQVFDQEGMLQTLFDDPFYAYNGFVWNKLYRRSILERCQVRFERKYGYNADRVFNFQYMRHMKEAIYNSRTYYHCVTHKVNPLVRDLQLRDYGALEGFERMLYYSRKYSDHLQRLIAKHYCRYALRIYRTNREMLPQIRPVISAHVAQLDGLLKWRCQLFLNHPAFYRCIG